ncbi:MAG: hypothetical protein ABFS14_07620 [Gemmatimonadota bacterium]
MRRPQRTIIGLSIVAAVLASSCASLQQFAALRKVQFDLGDVRGGRLAGVDLNRVRSQSDLTISDGARLAAAVAASDLPLEFTLNLNAENPASNSVTARMIRLQWTLLLQDRETISGVIDTAVALPPGQPRVIPMRMSLNLIEFFGGSATDLFNLAMGLAGAEAEPTTIRLRALPTVSTPIGPIDYPSPITVVSHTVGNQSAGATGGATSWLNMSATNFHDPSAWRRRISR